MVVYCRKHHDLHFLGDISDVRLDDETFLHCISTRLPHTVSILADLISLFVAVLVIDMPFIADFIICGHLIS